MAHREPRERSGSGRARAQQRPARRSTGAASASGTGNSSQWLSQYRRQWIQDRAGGSANFAESFNLLVQTITVGLGGFFAFGVVDEKNEASVAAKVISVVLIGINLVTLIPALRLVYTAVKARCCKAEGGDANMALLGGSE